MLSAVSPGIASVLMAVRRDVSRVAILAALLFALLPGAAGAVPRWLIPTPVSSTGGEAGAPDVTAFADGGTAVVWTGFAADESTHVYASVRGRSFNWVGGVPDDLEPGGGVTLGDARVVALPNGELIAAWRGGADPDYVRWSRWSTTGGWSPSEQLATPCCSGLGDLVAAADGSATLMYFDEGTPFTATLRPGADEWDEGEQLTGQADGFSLATAPDGDLVAAWADGCNEGDDCVYAAFKSPGQPWGEDELVNETSDDVSGIALAARPDGGFTVAWAEGGPPGSIRARDRSPGAGGTWGDYQTAAQLATDDHAGCRFGEVDCLDLAPAADGRLVAVWQQGEPPILRQQLAPAGPAVAASVRSPAGVWGEAELVGATGLNEAKPHAAFTTDGKVAAAWVADNVTRASWRSEDGSWTTTNIGGQPDDDDPTQHQDVAADADGNADTAWLEPSGVKLAGFDGVGPRFKVFSMPTSGTVGQGLTFSADVDDAWSYNKIIDWSLGDGAHHRVDVVGLHFASGDLTFTHAYSAPGTYAVSVTAFDDEGDNTTTRSGTVTISPPTVNCDSTDADNDKIGDACDSSDGSKPPVPFKTVSATVVSGDVFIKFPGGAGTARASQAAPKGFTRLQGSATIPVGATLDTSRGRVRLRSAADIRKGTQQGEFFDGVFKIGQVRKPRGKARKRPIGIITDLTLSGGSFSRCGAQASARSKRKVRRLWGDGKGSFRTNGRHAAATVRGTRWLVEDRCDGTLVRVRRGRVEVRDLRRARSVLVRAGHSYIARPR